MDDAVALLRVAVTQAERYGVGLRELFVPFIVECVVEEAMAQEKSLRLARSTGD